MCIRAATFTAGSILLGMATVVHADEILAAGSLFGGLTQTRAVCVFYNAGNTDLTLRGFQMFRA